MQIQINNYKRNVDNRVNKGGLTGNAVERDDKGTLARVEQFKLQRTRMSKLRQLSFS